MKLENIKDEESEPALPEKSDAPKKEEESSGKLEKTIIRERNDDVKVKTEFPTRTKTEPVKNALKRQPPGKEEQKNKRAPKREKKNTT